MTEELSGIFEDSPTDAEVEKKVDEEGWNMDAVEDFQRREQELAAAEEGGLPVQPAAEESSFSDINGTSAVGTEPTIAGEMPTGVGPVASPQEYSEMVRPGYQKAREQIGPGTAWLTTAVESAIPVAGAWADDLYSLIKANTNPKLTREEWQKAIYEEQDELSMPETASAIAVGSAAGYALPWGALKVAKDSVTAMKIASGFNALPAYKKAALITMASGAEGIGLARQDVTTKEGALEAAILSSSPIAFKLAAESTGRLGGWLWKKMTPDVDTQKAIDELIKTPYKFDDLSGAQVEREAAIRIYGKVVEKINEMHNAGKITAKHAQESIVQARQQWEKYEDVFSAAALKAGNLSNEETSGVMVAYKQLRDKVRDLERAAIAKLPETKVYLSSPESHGFKISDIERVKNQTVAKLKNSTKTYANAVIGELNAQMDLFYAKAAQDAIENGADPMAVGYVMRNRQWLTDPASRMVLSGKNISQKRLMEEAGTNLADVNKAISLVSNVSPERVHEMKGNLFEKSFGYTAQKDMTEDKKLVQSIYKSWHQDIRGEMARKYKQFEEATEVAENLKKEVLFPIKEKLKLKETNKEGARLGFENFAKEQLDQSTNVINRWSRETGVDFLNAANRIRHLNQFPLVTRGGKWNLTFDAMMDHIAEKKKIASEVLAGLGMLPPEIRVKFADLEAAATKAVDTQKELDILTDRILKESDKFGKFIGMPTMRGDGGKKSVQSIVEEITTKRYNPSSKGLFDITPEVRDALEIERFGREMYPTGIQIPGGGSVQINGLANRLQDVRKKELLDKSINIFKGSSAANIGYAIGATRGSKTAAIMSIAGSLVNSIGSLGAKNVIRTIMKHQIDSSLARTYSDLITANIARNVMSGVIDYQATVGTQELADVINAVRQDPKLTAANKVKIINDLKQNGIQFQIAMTE